MTWRDATRCAGLALRGVLPWRGVRCPGCVIAQRCAPPRPDHRRAMEEIESVIDDCGFLLDFSEA